MKKFIQKSSANQEKVVSLQCSLNYEYNIGGFYKFIFWPKDGIEPFVPPFRLFNFFYSLIYQIGFEEWFRLQSYTFFFIYDNN